MSSLSTDDILVLRKISDRLIDVSNMSSDVSERVEYLVTFGLARYGGGTVHITDAGRRALAGYKPATTRYRPVNRRQERNRQQQEHEQPATPYQTREQLIGEAVSRVLWSIFRLIVVYLLGVFTPYEIKLRILAFLAEMLTPIIEFIESLR